MGTVSISHCDMWAQIGKPERVYVTIDSLRDAVIPVYYKFKDKSQLRRLYAGFHFPSLFRTSTREKFTGEEVFLCGIQRLTFPNRTVETFWRTDFGFDHQQVSKAFNIFIGFIVINWAYLLLDHLDF